MGVDPFAALGVDQTDFAPQEQPSASGEMRIRPGGSQVNPFAALGVEQSPSYQPTPQKGAPQQSSSTRGIARNAAAGAVDAGSGLANVMSDPVGNLVGKPLAAGMTFAHDALAPVFGYKRFPDDIRNMLLDDNVPQPGTQVANAVGSAMGAPPVDSIPANGPAERLTRGAVGGAGMAAALGPAGVAAPLLGATGAVVGDQVGQSPLPEWAKPFSEQLASLGAMAGGAYGANKAGSAGRFVARKAGEMGVGTNKVDLGDFKATQAQIAGVGGDLKQGIGAEGRTNIQRSQAVEKQAQSLEKVLNDPDAHPDEKADAQSRLNEIQGLRVNLVPGSEPTTAQLAQTPGASGLEQSAKLIDEPSFIQRMKDQNNAQVQHIQDAEPTGQSSATVGQHIANKLAALDVGGQVDIADKQAQVGAQPIANAGQEPIATTGAKVRDTAYGAAQPWKQAYQRAWSLVDPDGTWAIQSQPLRDTSAKLLSEASPTAETDGQVNRLMARASSMPPTIKFNDLSQMRADANAAIARLSGVRGMEPEVRRVTLFKQGIDATIAQSIDEKATLDPALGAKLNAEFGGGVGSAQAGADGGVGAGTASSGSVGVPAGAVGNVGAGAGGRTNAGGDSGVPASSGTSGRPAKPQSLVDFLIRNGGVNLGEGEVPDAQAVHFRAAGRLINKNGMDPDEALSRAQTEGFLGKQGAGVNPVGINDLAHAVDMEVNHGQPTFRGADQAEADAWRQGQLATSANERFEQRLYDARDKVNSWVDQSGRAPLSPKEQEHAARLVAGNDIHPEDAVRSATTETEQAALDANAAKNAHGSPGVPLAAQQAAMPVEGGNRITPNMTPENAAQYGAAVNATREYKQQFAQGGVGKILQPSLGPNLGEFKVADANVPRQIFNRGNTEPQEVAHLIQTVGLDKAQPIARDVLSNELREKKIINPADGTIHAGKLADWRAARAETIKQFPDLEREFGSLQSAQEALNDVTARHVQKVQEFQDSAAAKFIGTEPNIAVRRILASDNPAQALTEVGRAVRGNKAAEASWKRALVEYIVDKTSTSQPSGDGVNMLSSAGFRGFMDQFRDALKVPFGGQGVQHLERVAAEMRRQAEQPKPIAGSQTVPNYMRAQKHGLGVTVGHTATTTVMALLGEHFAEMFSTHGLASAVGLALGVGGKIVWNSLKQSGIDTRQKLLAKAMLDPKFAEAAMEKADARGQISIMAGRKMAAALQASIASDLASQRGSGRSGE